MSQTDYSHFEPADFLLDDAFLQWVKNPDSRLDAFWENWKKAHPARVSVLEEARQLVLRLHASEEKLPPASFRRIGMHLDHVFDSLEGGAVKSMPVGQTGGFFSTNLYRIAAAVALLLAAGFILYNAVFRPGEAARYRTTYGESREISLPDGTVVVLNANSKLTTSAWSADKAREVWLEGEAFFRVSKKPASRSGGSAGEARFVVHTGNVDVEVLGTQFNVNHRRGQTTVILNEGQVRLGEGAAPDGEALMMVPGDLVRLAGKGGEVYRRRVDPGQYSSWTRNLYVFDDTPLKEVALLLEDHFNMRVIFKDPALAGRTFSATIPTRNPEVLLLALSESFGISINRKGNQLEFSAQQTTVK